MTTDSNQVIPKKKISYGSGFLLILLFVGAFTWDYLWEKDKGLVLLYVSLIFIWPVLDNINHNHFWKKFSVMSGLSIQVNSPGLPRNSLRLSGIYRGHEIFINAFSKKQGRYKKKYYQVEIIFPRKLSKSFTKDIPNRNEYDKGLTENPKIQGRYKRITENFEPIKKYSKSSRLRQGFKDLKKHSLWYRITASPFSLKFEDWLISIDSKYLFALLDWLILLSDALVREEQFDFC